MFEYRLVEYNEDDVRKMLEAEEDWTMDKKGKDILPGKLSKSISAFANTNGGELYIGLSHTKDKSQYYWDGCNNIESFNQFMDIACSVCKSFDDCTFEVCECSAYQTKVLHIIVQKTLQVICAVDNVPYLRVGAQNIPQNTPEKRRQLEYDKGIYSYENELTSCDFEDIKNSKVLNSFVKQAVPHTDSFNWLSSQALMAKDKRIMVAGVLLYSEIPQAILPKHCGIRIMRYHTDRKEGTRETLDPGFPISIEGDLCTLISDATKKTIEIVEQASVIGSSGIESKKYPEVTLHEIIANAVLHRDYSIAADIQIRIYTDRIEIESPGKLPGHITPKNILHEQLARNGKIVRLISKFPSPPNKDVGEGLNTAFEAMELMHLKRPIIVNGEKSVKVIIRHERLADPETVVLDYLKSHSSINNSEGREITGITDTIKMKDVFIRLKEKGLLEKVPGKRGNATRWMMAKSSGELNNITEDETGQTSLY